MRRSQKTCTALSYRAWWWAPWMLQSACSGSSQTCCSGECLCDGALSNAAAELPRGDLAAARLATEQMLRVCLRRGEAAQRGMAAADAPAPAVDGGRAAAAGTLESADLQRRAELLVQLRRTLCNVHRRQRVKVCAHLRLADPHSAKAHCLASAAGSVAPRPPRIPRRGIQRPQ